MPPIVKILLNVLLVAGIIFFLWKYRLEYMHDEEVSIKSQEQYLDTFDSLSLDKGIFTEGTHSAALTDTTIPRYIRLYDNAVTKIYFPGENVLLEGYISLHDFSEKFPNSAKSIRSALHDDLYYVKTPEIFFRIKNKDKNGSIPEIVVQFRKGQIDKVLIPGKASNRR